MSRCVTTLMLVGLIAPLGCDRSSSDRTPENVTSQDVRRDAAEAANTTAEYSQQAKEEFQQKLDAQLSELDAKIATLREKGADLKDDAKANWEQTMADLETKRDAARAKLAEVGSASAEAWKDVRKGAQSAWDELDRAFRDASQKF